MRISAFAPAIDFAAPKPPEPQEEPVIDTRLDHDEVAALVDKARAQAHQEGFEEGRLQGQDDERREVAARIEEAVAGLKAEMDALRAQETELFEELESRTARLMLALVHQLARRLSETEAKRIAENVAMRAVEAVRGKHRMVIRAPAELLASLRAVLRLADDEEAAAHRIEFETATKTDDAPLEVAWLTGKVTFDPYAFTGAIDDVFNETLEDLTGAGTPGA